MLWFTSKGLWKEAKENGEKEYEKDKCTHNSTRKTIVYLFEI